MNVADPSDDELMARLAAGERSALDALFERHNPLVKQIVARYVRILTDREDLVQETWLRVWCSGTFNSAKGSVAGWLSTIARNVCLDHLRTRNRLAKHEIIDSDATREDAEQSLVETAPVLSPSLASMDLSTVANFSDVVGCVRQLPDDLQEVVVLHLLEEIGLKELADLLEIALGSVHKRYRRGLRTVQWCLKQKGYRLGHLRIRLSPSDDRFDVDLIDTNLKDNSYDLVVWARDPTLRNKGADVAFLSLPGSLVFAVRFMHKTVSGVLFGDKRITHQAEIANSRVELVVSVI
jgi:RNA polymerase sigma-70 factor (ECF subfamily)